MATRRLSLLIKPVGPQFTIMAVSIVVCVFLAQVLTGFLPPLRPLVKEALLSVLALVLLLPLGYFLVALPVSNSIVKDRQSKNSLSKSEIHYRTVSELTTTFAFELLVSPEREVSLDFVSEDFYAFALLDREEPLTLDLLLSHIHPEDGKMLVDQLQRLIAKPQSSEVECRVYTGDPHEVRWLSICGKSVWDNKQTRVAVIHCAVRDITKQRVAEQALKESEYRLSRAEKIAKIGNWKMMLETGEMIASLGARDICGLDRHVMSMEEGKKPALPKYRAMLDSAMNDLIEKGIPYSTEFQIRKANDGAVVDVQLVAEHDKENNVVYGVMRDITERKRSEEALLESQRQIEFILEATKTGLDLIDEDFNMRYLDPRWSKLYGKWQGRKCYEYFQSRTDPCTDCSLQIALRTKQTAVVEQTLVTEGNRLVQTTAIPYQDRGGKWLVAEISVDISEHKKVEEALRESEMKYRILFDSEMFAIHVFDMETLEILDMNERHISLYGYSREEMTSGMTVLDLTAEENETKKAIDQIRNAETLYVPLRYQRKKDGSIFPAEFANALFVWKGRKVCIASTHDISERKRAEDEQARVQNLLAVSQRIAHIGSWEYEYSGEKISLSEEMHRIAGIPASSPITLKFAESFLPVNEFLRLRKAIEACIQRGVPYVVDCQIQRPDGQFRTLHNEAEVVFDGLGRPVRVFGISQDITERKQADEALQTSQQIIEGLLNAIPAGIFWKDRNLNFLGCDEAFAHDAGFDSPRDIVGKDDFQMSWRQYAEQYRRDDQEVIESGRPKLFIEEPHINANGHVLTALTSKVPLRDSKGEITGVLGAYMDITEQRRTEQALRENERKLIESEAKYKRLIETAPAAIFVIQDDRIVFLNNHAPELSGYSKEELLEMPVRNLFSDADWEDSRQRQNERLKGRTLPNNITSHKKKNGSTIWVETVGVLIDWEGKPAVLYFVSDITDRKAAESERIEYEQYLQQAQRLESLGVLAGGIAHDFNNILTGIFGYTDLARSEAKDESVSEYLSQAMESMERAKSLTQQLLTFSKGGVPIKKIVPMLSLIRETCQFSLHGSNVRGKYNLQEDLWHCEIDKNQIGQVIQNLILNAVQAMPLGGTIEIAAKNASIPAKAYPNLNEGNYVAIEIKDHGIGISEDMLSRIFDPFFTTKIRGHGLGLAISHSIITRHGGAIDVKSELGKGTIFTIYLPACQKPYVETPENGSIKHTGTGRILVLDDELPLRELMSLMLESFGYSVIGKENGKAAFEAFLEAKRGTDPFKAVILDLTIPGGMGGKEVAEEIRKIDVKVPLFVASGYAADPIIAQPEEYGFTASISKPFKMVELMEMLEKHMGKG